jgi:hypothetical protein
MMLQTLSDFFETTRTHFHVFDMGRRIVKISPTIFRQFEEGKLAYPTPLQQQAWLAILGWGKGPREDHFIWFLKFPLDEMAQLVQAARDDFLQHLLESIGHNAASSKEGGIQDTLNDSPYGYRPRDDVMAIFHAKALKSMGAAPTRFFDHAREYLEGRSGYDQWAFVGIQGLADVAARLDDEQLNALVARAIPHLPSQPLQALCGCLEHEAISTAVAERLIERIAAELASDAPDSATIVSALRGLSFSRAQALRKPILLKLLNSPLACSIDLLAAIAARCWNDLQDEQVCQSFVEALASNTLGQEGFNQILADLMFIPGMRHSLLTQLRNPSRSEKLTAAVERLLSHQNN